MDKKSDRQFYWEVKDFMSSKKPVNEVNKKTSSIVDSVKSVLEQNKPFKQQAIGTNSNTINGVRQAIGYIQNDEKRFKPECKAFTKNVDTNAFRTLNEAFMDQYKERLDSLLNMNKSTDSGMQKKTTTSPLDPEVDPNLSPSEQMQKDIDATQKPKDALKTPTASVPTPSTEKTTDSDLEKRVAARLRTREKTKQSEMRSGEENLAYLKAKDTSKMTERDRQRHSQALLRAEKRAKGETSTGLSDEAIRGQEERQLARERKAPVPNIATGSKTPPAAQTAPKFNRI